MQLDAQGWLKPPAQRLPSPNVDARPPGTAITLLVIHNISLPAGCFGGPAVSELFTNQLDTSPASPFAELAGLRVSAHFFIRRDGSVVQFASTLARAWHAGVSSFRGKERCNDFSLGIELEGTDLLPYTDKQYAQLTVLTLALRAQYPLQAVVGHEHIAPGRKTDPGPAFDWQRYVRAANWAPGQFGADAL